MIKICRKCNHTMAYDSYFKAYICRQCGNREAEKDYRRMKTVTKKGSYCIKQFALK